MQEPDGIENAPKIPNTLEIHKIKRAFDAAKVCSIEFYFLASDTDSFYALKYSGVNCGHNNLKLEKIFVGIVKKI